MYIFYKYVGVLFALTLFYGCVSSIKTSKSLKAKESALLNESGCKYYKSMIEFLSKEEIANLNLICADKNVHQLFEKISKGEIDEISKLQRRIEKIIKSDVLEKLSSEEFLQFYFDNCDSQLQVAMEFIKEFNYNEEVLKEASLLLSTYETEKKRHEMKSNGVNR